MKEKNLSVEVVEIIDAELVRRYEGSTDDLIFIAQEKVKSLVAKTFAERFAAITCQYSPLAGVRVQGSLTLVEDLVASLENLLNHTVSYEADGSGDYLNCRAHAISLVCKLRGSV